MSDSDFKSQRVIVMGLGRFGGGIGVTRWLCAQGAQVTVTDTADAAALASSLASLDGCPVEFRLGGHDAGDLEGVHLVVVSPAVNRRTSPFFQTVLERGIAWTTEMNLFLERCVGRLIGVTGTAGKSTTCALIYEVLKAAAGPKERVWFGGNVGRSLLDSVSDIQPEDWVLMELSSFQLEAISRINVDFEIGLLTNCRPHHLDRHGNFEDYLQSKMNLFACQHGAGHAVVGEVDASHDALVQNLAEKSGAKFSRVPDLGQSFVLRLPGAHNQRNASCAFWLTQLMGIDEPIARRAMASFAGLAHRLEHVALIDGVDYFNDSKSTTPQASALAVMSFDRPMVLIVGGQDCGQDFTPLLEALESGVKAILCVGQAADRLRIVLDSPPSGGRPETVEVSTCIPSAVERARGIARPGDVVVLTPGAPSYGEFVNYEHRGQTFVSAVKAIVPA